MPTLAKIGNIKIQVFAGDHNPPHFHVVTPDEEVLVRLSNFTAMAGTLSSRSMDIALEWARAHEEDLQNEWNRLNP